MKKFFAILLILSVACSFCACSMRITHNPLTDEPSSSLTAEELTEASDNTVAQTDNTTVTTQQELVDYKSEYRRIIQQYENTYGEMSPKDEALFGYVSGVCFLKLVDFNADGIDELVIVYRDENEGFFEGAVFTVYNNEVTEVRDADIIANKGTSVQPYIAFFTKDGYVYCEDEHMRWGDTVDIELSYITLYDDSMVTYKSFEFSETEQGSYTNTYVDGGYVTADEFLESFSPWDTNEHSEDLEYFSLETYTDELYDRLETAVNDTKAQLGF